MHVKIHTHPNVHALKRVSCKKCKGLSGQNCSEVDMEEEELFFCGYSSLDPKLNTVERNKEHKHY